MGRFKMETYTKQELDEILRLHKLWLENNKDGVRADLRSANLSWADLRSANLRSADLSSANLSWAKTDKRYIQISCIGSRKDITTYCFEDDKIWCGCYTGTLGQFEKRVERTHKDNKQYRLEYLGWIKYIKMLRKEKANDKTK
jgi:hypothetical protein